LFVYAPPTTTKKEDAAQAISTFGKQNELDLWGLLEKLLDGISEVSYIIYSIRVFC
jgi:hypothetical protein